MVETKRSVARRTQLRCQPEQDSSALARYSWFTEGFDTVDLKEAKALLDQLA
jgi:predicted metalloprotease